jgi:hypothetical protein
MSIWGMKASGGNYAALAALTNIPAMLFAVLLYEIFLADSSRGLIIAVCLNCQCTDYLLSCVVMPGAQMEFMIGHQKHQEEHGAPPHHILSDEGRKRTTSTSSTTKEKLEHIENNSRV